MILLVIFVTMPWRGPNLRAFWAGPRGWSGIIGHGDLVSV